MKYLTFALAKGRLAKQSLTLFEKIGIPMEEMRDPDTRKLIFVNEDLKISSRYRRCRKRYTAGRRQKALRGSRSRIRQMQYVCLRTC